METKHPLKYKILRRGWLIPLHPMIVYCKIAKMAIMEQKQVKTLSARDAKNRFGFLIDTARQEPVSVEKHGRPVVVVLSIEDYERLLAHPLKKADKRWKEAR